MTQQPTAHTAASNTRGFLSWVQQHQFNDWCHLLACAGRDIAQMAADASIDWNSLRQAMPEPDTLLKGAGVAVIHSRDRGRSAFVWHLQPDRYSQQWPCRIFMGFRRGGVHQIFNGYRWAWLQFKRGGQRLDPSAALPILREHGQAMQPADRLCLPQFAANVLKECPTDFNDLLRLQGIVPLLQQVGRYWPAES